MQSLKIALNRNCPDCFATEREITNLLTTDFIDVAAAVLSVPDLYSGIMEQIEQTGFGLPVFVAINENEMICGGGIISALIGVGFK
ncbi:Orn/Lys/Arg decarboxylase N-terminal domain-containing protein [Cedecea neteri]|uniref:Orn/Lys/Arg decarboxylase N-terminal domain-containing protein n=1 Tax=Cedecea neteri TaxID=158822 RepID=A0A291E0R5_9ENTR|nr:Orn/Lys/Arg decarboxylase N-terminal domain-containing protein [Cedecea neteri]ATF93647.1 hypothetical protein CO704_16775 [Cedecea neteri]